MNELIVYAVFGYLLGSIPFGLVLCYIFGYGDIRKIGSGNIGATNVLRTGNKFLAFITLLLDSGKGAISVLISLYIMNTDFNTAMIAGFGSILGHLFPVWLKFKGGKGVATTFGTLLALSPYTGLITCIIWLITALIFRISSLSALIAVLASPVISYFLYPQYELLPLWCTVVAAIVWAKHHQNIKRIIKGEEPKIGKKK